MFYSRPVFAIECLDEACTAPNKLAVTISTFPRERQIGHLKLKCRLAAGGGGGGGYGGYGGYGGGGGGGGACFTCGGFGHRK